MFYREEKDHEYGSFEFTSLSLECSLVYEHLTFETLTEFLNGFHLRRFSLVKI